MSFKVPVKVATFYREIFVDFLPLICILKGAHIVLDSSFIVPHLVLCGVMTPPSSKWAAKHARGKFKNVFNRGIKKVPAPLQDF